MTKDTTRENRRNYKDNKDRDNRRDDRDFEGRNTSRNGKNNNKNNNNNRNTVRKKPVNIQPKPEPVVEKVTSIELPETVTIKELADKMKIPAAQIIKKLFLEGKMYNVNSDITYDEAEEIALEYDILCEHEVVVDVIEETKQILNQDHRLSALWVTLTMVRHLSLMPSVRQVSHQARPAVSHSI